MSDRPTNVIEALSRVSADLGAIGKDRKRSDAGGNFKYRGIDDVLNALHGPLHRNGVVIVPIVEGEQVDRPEFGKNGGFETQMTVTYRIYGPNGPQDFIEAKVFTTAMDSSDKGTGKAMSYAYKNLIFQLLCVPTDSTEDNEAESLERERRPASAVVPVPEDYHGWPSKAEHDRWWTEVSDMLRSLPAPALNQAISKLTEEDLFVERKPRLPFSREQSKRVGAIVLAEGVAADREPVEVPDDGLEDWQRELALVEDVAAFDWKKAAGKLIPLRPVPLFKMAKEAAARIGADEPHDLGSIDGAVGQELVLALIDLQPPF